MFAIIENPCPSSSITQQRVFNKVAQDHGCPTRVYDLAPASEELAVSSGRQTCKTTAVCFDRGPMAASVWELLSQAREGSCQK